MEQLIVQHYRGLKEHYNIASHGQGVYFAADTKEIIMNGVAYSGEGGDSFLTLEAKVQENSDALLVLQGSGEGSVIKTVNDAINEFATKISEDGTVNTFKELVDYAAEHSSEIVEFVSELNGVKKKNTEQDSRIEAIEVLVGGSEEGGSTLVETVSEHAEAIQMLQSEMDAVVENSFANASEISGLKDLVGTASVKSQIDEALAWENVG